jgi:hypothetical protein
MEGDDHKIPKEENAYFSFRHGTRIRRELIPNDMIHLIRIHKDYEVYIHVLHWKKKP